MSLGLVTISTYRGCLELGERVNFGILQPSRVPRLVEKRALQKVNTLTLTLPLTLLFTHVPPAASMPGMLYFYFNLPRMLRAG